MNYKRKARHIQIYGRSGSGKSTIAEHYFWGSDFYLRKFVFDHEGEIEDKYGIEPVRSVEELYERVQNESVIVFDPSEYDSGEADPFIQAFDDFCNAVFDVAKQLIAQGKKEQILLMVDELQKFTGTQALPKPLQSIMQTGRRYGVDTLIISQAPNEIHNRIRAQATEMYIFRLQGKNPTAFLKELGLEYPDLHLLPDLSYKFINLRTGEEIDDSIKIV